MATKITVIGAGSVGATMAYTLCLEALATEIVLIDINNKKADGEALDILQSTAYREPIAVKAGTYEDATNSDIVIITSGLPRKPNMTRLDLVNTNVGIIRDIASKIAPVCPKSKYIIVSNPVDILTYVFIKESGIPENQVIGSGTQLDTARLRCYLAEECSISQKNVHAYVFGEHGDSSFVPWSSAHIAGIPVDEYYKKYALNRNLQFDKDHIIDEVRKSGSVVIADKGATFYAVTVAVINICKIILSDALTITTVSTMLHGEYGINDVCLSISCILGPQGVAERLELHLTDEEVKKLQASAAKLREILDQVYSN